jgi:hypothetical protein
VTRGPLGVADYGMERLDDGSPETDCDRSVVAGELARAVEERRQP